jgi:hypothetical protein
MINKRVPTPKTLSSGVAALALGCAFVASTTQAAVIIPDKGGFSGYLNLGAGAVEVESNTLSSIAGGNIDIGDKILDDLNESPDSNSKGIPAVNFELSYTFESTRTQLHIGNLMEDFLRFDTSTVAGVRQDVGNAGLIGASVQGSSLAAQVWRDPYQTGTKRKDTDRTSTGGRLYWQQIMGSGLEIRLSASDIDIDKERSGNSLLDLSKAQRKLLDRNGDVIKVDLFYEFYSDDERHVVTPGLGYVDRDLDGEAMANDGVNASLNYIYKYDDHWRWVFNASYSDLDSKKRNPIYGETDSASSYGISATFFFSEPFGWKKWAFNGTAAYFDEDHDIDFYDNSVALVSMGMLRKF